jgi:hypothetical protein
VGKSSRVRSVSLMPGIYWSIDCFAKVSLELSLGREKGCIILFGDLLARVSYELLLIILPFCCFLDEP